MAKRQPPKPEPNDPNEDLDEAEVPEGPCPWNLEIEFVDEKRQSVMVSVRAIVLDAEHVQLQLEDGKLVAYPFDQVRKILGMHSVRYDLFLTESKQAGEAAQE